MLPNSWELRNTKLFGKTLLILWGILIIFFSSNNFLIFYIIFEFSLIPILIIILGRGYQPERLQASIYLLLYTSLLSLPLLIIILYLTSHRFSNYFFISLFSNFRLSQLAFLCFFLRFLTKCPIYFLHLWLPKAHVEASVGGRIILARILLKIGGLGIYRFRIIFPPLLENIILIFLLAGRLLRSIFCLLQSDHKALIAFSSVNHITLLVLVLIFKSFKRFIRASILIFIHGVVASGIFFFAYSFTKFWNRRLLYFRSPLLNWASILTLFLLIILCGNFSVPPLLSFFSEINIIRILRQWRYYRLPIIVLTLFIGCLFRLFLFLSTSHRKRLLIRNSSLSHLTPHLFICSLYAFISIGFTIFINIF